MTGKSEGDGSAFLHNGCQQIYSQLPLDGQCSLQVAAIATLPDSLIHKSLFSLWAPDLATMIPEPRFLQRELVLKTQTVVLWNKEGIYRLKQYSSGESPWAKCSLKFGAYDFLNQTRQKHYIAMVPKLFLTPGTSVCMRI